MLHEILKFWRVCVVPRFASLVSHIPSIPINNPDCVGLIIDLETTDVPDKTHRGYTTATFIFKGGKET